MYNDFLNDRCNIYHLQLKSQSLGFGIEDESVKMEYSAEPDLADVPCHFNRHGLFEGLTETNASRVYHGVSKVQFPLGTDIRMNDRIEDIATGTTYTASVPWIVGRSHHIAVQVTRMAQESRL